ncbi:serine--tRNA ligase [Candidatus Dojkabacteria bacterium]|nr:serine--tRNA ligase [Candidatus Dojkabacteria bacterium]
MLDIKFIRENIDRLQEVAKDKNVSVDIIKIIELDDQLKNLEKRLNELQKERNENADLMKKSGGKPDQAAIDKGRQLKEEIQKILEETSQIKPQFDELMAFVPMIPSEDTPVGNDESNNVEVRRWSKEGGDGGDPEKFNFKIKDHIQLGLDLDLFDLEKGATTSGFRGYYLKNDLVLLHFGLMQYALSKMIEKGFTPMVTPTIVNEKVLFGSGHFPFDTGNIYYVDSMTHVEEEQDSSTRKYLAGTSEPALLGYHADETLNEENLPIKFAGFSPCYRSEIGSYGKDTKGLYRIHEFLKIEQVVICKNDKNEAEKWHQQMLSYAEEVLRDLGLPYRVLQICTGDMGAGKYKMYDIETWMPSREGYGETHSASNLLDWQARRLNTRVKTKNGEKYYPYMLNNTVIASPRILIAILENYQQEDGSIKVPEVLQKYVGKKIIN